MEATKRDTPGSNLSPEGVPHSYLDWDSFGQQKGPHSMLIYIMKTSRYCRRGCGKFSHQKRKCPNLFTLHLSHCTPNLEGLKAAKASVELDQSASLLMTSCLQLDCCWKGRGDLAWKGASLPLPPHFLRRDSRAQGPLGHCFRQNWNSPQIPDQKLFSACTNAYEACRHSFPMFNIYDGLLQNTDLSLQRLAKF